MLSAFMISYEDANEKEVKKRSRSAIVFGALLIAAGLAAVLLPQIATITLELVIGGLLIFSGIIAGVHEFYADRSRYATWHAAAAVIVLLTGVLLVAYPWAGVAGLTLFLALYFLVAGVNKTVVSLRMRRGDGWGWLLFAGIVDIALGAMVFFLWPNVALWLIGLLFGISLMFQGWWVITVALLARKRFEEPA